MGFNRTDVSPTGKLRQPLRSGDGFIANVAPVNFNTQTDETLTMSDLGGGAIHQGLTLTSDVIYTLPLGTLMEASFVGMDLGDAYTFAVTNGQAAAFDVVLAVAAGVTAVGTNNSLSVAPQSTRMFTLIKTATDTFTVY